MTKNPFLNALAAVAYILLVATAISYVPTLVPEPSNPISVVMAFLSLFVFSAAAMGYFLILAPVRLLVEGQKGEAVSLFLKTLAAFAGTAFVLFLLSLLLPAGPNI